MSRLACLVLLLFSLSVRAQDLPNGFVESTVFTEAGLIPSVRFAPDGRAFVTQLEGLITTYDCIADNTPTLVADISSSIYSFSEHGLMSLAVDPEFPAQPYIY